MIGKKTNRKKNHEEIRDFEKCHPMPSPDDEERDNFWKKVIDRMKEAEGANGMTIYSFVRFDIVKKCMNTSLTKKTSLIMERNSTVMGEFDAIIIATVINLLFCQ